MKTLSVFLLLGSVSLTLGAQMLVPPLAPDDFPVNGQPLVQDAPFSPRPAMAPDGTIAVTWPNRVVPTQMRILARRFDANGSPLDDDFFVSQSDVGDQSSPSIAGDDAGDFVVMWESTLQDGSGSGIYGRRYVGGLPASDEFLVNGSETAGDQKAPAVATAPDGRFVVVWETDRPDPAGADVVGQLYDASGSPVGTQFDVDVTDGPQTLPAVAMDATGAFVVVWQGVPADAPTLDNIFARRFASDGTPLGDPFQINTTSDVDQVHPAIATDGTGRYLVVWDRIAGTVPHDLIRGRYLRGADPEGPDFAVANPFEGGSPPAVSMSPDRALVTWSAKGEMIAQGFDGLGRPGQSFNVALPPGVGAFAPAVAGNALGRFVATWVGFPDAGTGIFGRIGAAPDALDPAVDPPASAGIPFNGILESGEQAAFAPTYLNTSPTPEALTGSLVANFGPPGSEVAVADGTADYGALPAAAAGDCLTATGDCYAVFVARGPNVIGHWDPVFIETLSNGATKSWALHVGETFLDVSASDLYYSFIESIAHYEVTAGCGNDNYCSDASVARAEMAVFLLKSRYGRNHAPPPATGTVFDDVHLGDFASDWIEELAALGITAGCSGTSYCPGDPVTREQMAVFLLKTLEGSGYTPPDPAGVFGDVPTDDPFAPWIEDLAGRQITGGCQADPLLYCPLRPTSRGEMAVFLTKTFSLVLYGP